MIKILIACAMGAGSSLMMKMKVQEVLKELGVHAEVYHCPISEAKGIAGKYDLVLTAVNFVPSFKKAQEEGTKVIGIKNVLSAKEIKDKILESGVIHQGGEH